MALCENPYMVETSGGWGVRIVKQGKLPRLDALYIGTCWNCETEVEASRGEISIYPASSIHIGDVTYFVACPVCTRSISVEARGDQ